jgi:hypothetical protein
MDQSSAQRWWALHLRVARGETLGAEDQGFYQTGLGQLEQEEMLQGARSAVRELRARVAALESEHAALTTRRREVEAEIAALEASLGERGRHLLGMED